MQDALWSPVRDYAEGMIAEAEILYLCEHPTRHHKWVEMRGHAAVAPEHARLAVFAEAEREER